MSASNPIRRSRAEWEQLIADQRASGRSQAEFCRQAAVSLSTFTYWKRELSDGTRPAGSRQAETEAPMFAELAVAEPETTESSAPAGWDVELDLGGIILRIRRPA